MTMLAGTMLFATLILWCFPDTAVGRWMQRMLVDAPLASLARIERRHLIFVLLMSIVLIAGAEMLAMAGPFDMALVLLWDVSTYVDIVLVTASVATVARGRTAWRVLVQRVLPRPRARSLRRRIAKPARKPANDDRPGSLALAA